MTLRERYDNVLSWFAAHRPDAETELHYKSPFELLVAVILSAQCTDKRVNMVTPALFRAFPTPASMAAAGAENIFPFIRSISYPNNKASHLAGMSRMLVEEFGGQVPGEMSDLVKLPGVGRKTANVISSVVFHQPAIAVDTHVFRVSARLGLAPGAKNPLQTERKLTKYIPEEQRSIAHHWLILHGRYVCTARNPRCGECGLKDFCLYYKKVRKPVAPVKATTSRGRA